MEIIKKLELLCNMFELEEGAIQPETVLAEMEVWDSMAKLSLIVLMDDEFGKRLTGAQIKEFKTAQDILNFMD